MCSICVATSAPWQNRKSLEQKHSMSVTPNTVVQSTPHGCGIACFAMLTSMRFEDAARIIGHSGDTQGVTAQALSSALESTGILLGEARYFGKVSSAYKRKRLKDQRTDCLLHASISDEGHWMVWHHASRRVLDPMQPSRGGSRLRNVDFYHPVWLTGMPSTKG